MISNYIKDIINTFKELSRANYNLGRAKPPKRIPPLTEEQKAYYRKVEKFLEGKEIISTEDLKIIFEGRL